MYTVNGCPSSHFSVYPLRFLTLHIQPQVAELGGPASRALGSPAKADGFTVTVNGLKPNTNYEVGPTAPTLCNLGLFACFHN